VEFFLPWAKADDGAAQREDTLCSCSQAAGASHNFAAPGPMGNGWQINESWEFISQLAAPRRFSVKRHSTQAMTPALVAGVAFPADATPQ
jgi:hypothetical protein